MQENKDNGTCAGARCARRTWIVRVHGVLLASKVDCNGQWRHLSAPLSARVHPKLVLTWATLATTASHLSCYHTQLRGLPRTTTARIWQRSGCLCSRGSETLAKISLGLQSWLCILAPACQRAARLPSDSDSALAETSSRSELHL
jgi:hypothetical protein